MGINELYLLYEECDYNVCTDTRETVLNSLFFALSGENFDGNKFVHSALEKGCLYAVCDNKDVVGENIIHVSDVLKTLQELANFHRLKFDIPVLGITGSNGKTTTKELLASVLKEKFDLLFTKENLNNHIGVPLTLLKLRKNNDFALIEMGANKEGDINELCNIADPTHGIITNIGLAHLEGFGSKEGVVKTKSEMYHYIIEKQGLLFVNNNEPYLIPLTKKYSNCIPYGKGTDTDFKLHDSDIKLEFSVSGINIKTNLFGKYNANNALTAFAVGKYFSIEEKRISNALEHYKPSNNRSQIKNSKKGNHIILDAYNANPTSMNLAIEELLQQDGDKFFILGDMKELGYASENEHKNVIKKIIDSGCKCIFIGPEFNKHNYSNLISFKRVEDLIASANLKFISNYKVLVKGSRSIQLEKLELFL